MTPVKPVPPQRVAGGGTREVFTHVHLRFLHERSSANALIKKDLPEVCSLSSWVSPLVRPYPFHYRTTFACSSIFYPHRPRRSLRFACHYSHGSNTGLPCSESLTRWRRFRLFPGGSIVRVFPCERGTTHRTPFWFRLVSTFSLFRLTRFIIGSHVLTFPSSLAPDPPWCWQTRSRLAVESWRTLGYIVLAASHPAITRGAWASRLLLTAQQVWLDNLLSTRQSTTRLCTSHSTITVITQNHILLHGLGMGSWPGSDTNLVQ
jgi:hypothetical protein